MPAEAELLRQLAESQAGTALGVGGGVGMLGGGAGVAGTEALLGGEIVPGTPAGAVAGGGMRAGASKKMKGLFALLQKGKYKEALSKHPNIMGSGIGILLNMLVGKAFKGGREIMDIKRATADVEEQTAQFDPENIYYQSQLPTLQAEKRQAQDILLQTVLGGRGQTMQVPGERRVGG